VPYHGRNQDEEYQMSRINPETLQQARSLKKWSLKDLSEKSGVNQQSIHRIEKGNKKHNRKIVIERLAKALKISEEELTGNVRLRSNQSEKDETDELLTLLSQSQLNLRVSDLSRNALSLAATHYRVNHSQIVEIAPFLFCWAAEQSLKLRRDRLAEIDKANEELAQLQPSHIHAANFVNVRSEQPLEAERLSVEKNDLFGTSIDGDAYTFLPDDYDEAMDNPFAVFLRNLTKDCGELAAFEKWDPESSPTYTVCRSAAVKLVGGDTLAADEILNGDVSLHKLPKDLRGTGKGEARATWVYDELEAKRAKMLKRIDIASIDLDI
jgi:transcriptional regulator with XRE-family HTH domain